MSGDGGAHIRPRVKVGRALEDIGVAGDGVEGQGPLPGPGGGEGADLQLAAGIMRIGAREELGASVQGLARLRSRVET